MLKQDMLKQDMLKQDMLKQDMLKQDMLKRRRLRRSPSGAFSIVAVGVRRPTKPSPRRKPVLRGSRSRHTAPTSNNETLDHLLSVVADGTGL
jgi:hypothetical protein